MKGFLAIVLVGAVVAFYFGYSPSDLLYCWPSFGSSNTPPPNVRRAQAATADQAPAAAPAPRRSGGSPAVGNDGSLEHRWRSDPTSSPAKP
jgi:hypothetical protein